MDWDAVRDLLESWFGRFPASGQRELLRRFQSSATHETVEAFWELYLHELFKLSGCNILLHPDLPDSNHKPDFLIEWGSSQSAYVEATVLGLTRRERETIQRQSEFLDRLDELHIDNFWLDIEIYRDTPLIPSIGSLRDWLNTWLAPLNPDDYISMTKEASEWWARLPRRMWKEAGWVVSVRAIPKSPENRGKRTRTIGSDPSFGDWVTDDRDILKVLRRKRKHYNVSDRAFIVAVMCARSTCDHNEFQQALFSRAREHPSVLKSGKLSSPWKNQDEGLWITSGGPARNDVSAVLVSTYLQPWMVACVEPVVYHNPWANHPALIPLKSGNVRIDLSIGEMVDSPPEEPIAEYFGLDKSWPNEKSEA